MGNACTDGSHPHCDRDDQTRADQINIADAAWREFGHADSTKAKADAPGNPDDDSEGGGCANGAPNGKVERRQDRNTQGTATNTHQHRKLADEKSRETFEWVTGHVGPNRVAFSPEGHPQRNDQGDGGEDQTQDPSTHICAEGTADGCSNENVQAQ